MRPNKIWPLFANAIASALLVLSCVSSVNAAIVDAREVTTVTVDAPLYDPNLASANGCDPAGCVGDLTRDGDLTDLRSRWSCRPALGPTGSTCSITYTLGESLAIEALKIAMYKGNLRSRTLDVYIDGVKATSWTSSGTTAAFETVDITGAAETIELRAVVADTVWVSIMEVEILVDDGLGSNVVEAGTLGTITTAAAVYDPNLSTAGGCDPAGCTASLTRDGDFTANSRWSCSPKLGGPCTISYDLGAIRDLSELRLAMYKGTTRTRTMDVFVDGVLVATWTSSGTTEALEGIDLSGTSGELIEVTGVLGSTEWLSIIETEIMVLANGVTPPTPSPPPAVTLPPTIGTEPPVTPGGDLQPVGLIPLAEGDGDDLERFYVKDGDLETSWTCTGDPQDIYYACSLAFKLTSYRHVKQLKIALGDGAAGPVNLRFAAWKPNTVGDTFKFEEFVTSSGTTDGFETYDFDYFTDRIEISGDFTSNGQSITISEVEIVEELQPGVVSVYSFTTPYENSGSPWNEATTDKFEWSSDSNEALNRDLTFVLSSYATASAMEIQFPVGDTYKFDLEFYVDDESQPTIGISGEPFLIVQDFESADVAGWQSFDFESVLGDRYITMVNLIMKGTGSGAPGFSMLDARVIGTPIANPSGIYYVGSTFIETWYSDRYPDFVAEGASDQKTIMAAICAAKKASFDGEDCVGEDAAATGTVHLPLGDFLVDGNIFMKSGVALYGRYTDDDAPFTTDILLQEGAAGNTDVDAIVVMDGISDALISDLWIRGLYDPETSNANSAVPGLGATCLSVTNSQNVTCKDTEIRFCDGDAMVVRDSNIVNIDAGRYDEEFKPWTIGVSRGTGLIVDTCDSVWVRRHTLYDNGIAGIHIMGSNNFTFEATISNDDDDFFPEGQGNVGSLDGQQPIEVIVESSSLVTFQDMKVTSNNEPVMMISADSSAVSFNSCGFSSVQSGICVIQTEDPAVVTVVDDELMLEGTCYVKV